MEKLKELGLGCEVLVQHYVGNFKDKTEIITLDKSHKVCDLTGAFIFTNGCRKPLEIIKIIGKPMTLNKLILILKTNGQMVKKNNKWYILFTFNDIDIYWDLQKDTVKEQKKGTQKLINKLITKIGGKND